MDKKIHSVYLIITRKSALIKDRNRLAFYENTVSSICNCNVRK